MDKKHADPVVVGEYPSEFEASIVRNMLSAEGIPAEVQGGMVAGFRAEVPGMVRVIVPAGFQERALKLLVDIDRARIDDDSSPEAPDAD